VIVDVAGPDGEALLGALQVPSLDGVPRLVLAGDPLQAQHLRDRVDDYAVKPFAETLLVRLGSVVGRRRAESARAEADARFRAVFEHAPTGMALVTPDGRLLEVNAALTRLLGLVDRPAGAVTLDQLTHPDDLLHGPASFVPAGDRAPLRLERRLVAADGRVVPAVLTISAIREAGAARQLVVQIEEAGAQESEGVVLEQVLAAQLARCVRYDEHAALLLVEIDHHGGGPADGLRTAARVAAAVRRRLRRSDMLVPLGERRFGALLVNAGTAEAMAVARSVHAAILESGAPGEALRGAVGVSAFGASATAPRIVAEAELALRRARAGTGVAA
jgi:PAS domain S-box-containing protein